MTTHRLMVIHARRSMWALCVAGLVLASLLTSSVSARSTTFELAYLEVLDALIDDPVSAIDALIDLEVDEAADGAPESIQALSEQQRHVASNLSSSDPELLVPLVRLHEQAYLRHLEDGRLLLAVHSRELAAELIQLYVERAWHRDSTLVASDLLASLGGHLQQASMGSAAGSLYGRALKLNPRHEAASLGLAGMYERQGNYDRALNYLEQLLRYRPDHREARLRHGINLLRLERYSQGREELELLLETPTEDWVLSLAYQELAQLAIDRNDVVEAKRLLEEAVRRLPEDPTLPVTLAYLADRAGIVSRGASLQEALQIAASSRTPSPRSTYSRITGVALEELRVEVSDHNTRRLPALARRLEQINRPEAGAP